MKIVRLGFLFLSGLYLVLHSCIAHHHSSQDDREVSCIAPQVTSIYDLLHLVFHNDPGNNHMEDFGIQRGGLDSTINLAINEFLGCPTSDFLGQIVPNGFELLLKDQPHPELSFRGPPSKG